MAEETILPAQGIDDILVGIAKQLGIDDILRRLNNEDDGNQKPNFWTENKNWLLPSLIGGGALFTVILIAKK